MPRLSSAHVLLGSAVMYALGAYGGHERPLILLLLVTAAFALALRDRTDAIRNARQTRRSDRETRNDHAQT